MKSRGFLSIVLVTCIGIVVIGIAAVCLIINGGSPAAKAAIAEAGVPIDEEKTGLSAEDQAALDFEAEQVAEREPLMREMLAELSPLEAARFARHNMLPPFYDLFYETVDDAIEKARKDRNPDEEFEALMLKGDGVSVSRSGYEEEYAEYAREAFARAVEIRPKSGEARRELGMVLIMQGNPDEAIAELKKVIELGEDGAHVQWLLGHAYNDKGELKEALKHYEKTHEYDPEAILPKKYVEIVGAKVEQMEKGNQ